MIVCIQTSNGHDRCLHNDFVRMNREYTINAARVIFFSLPSPPRIFRLFVVFDEGKYADERCAEHGSRVLSFTNGKERV